MSKRTELIHFECSHEAGVCIVDDEAFDEYASWEQEYLNHSSSITGLFEDY